MITQFFTVFRVTAATETNKIKDKINHLMEDFMKLNPLLTLFLLTSLLSACASMNSKEEHKAVCNELKSNIIFNGSTGNVRNAEIQNAETPLSQRQFDKTCEQ